QAPARSLTQTCGGRPATILAGLEAHLRARLAKGSHDVVERFSTAETTGIRTRDVDRSVRTLLCAAVRAGFWDDCRQCLAAGSPLFDCRAGDSRGQKKWGVA